MTRDNFIKLLDDCCAEYIAYYDEHTCQHIVEVARENGNMNHYVFTRHGEFVKFYELHANMKSMIETIMECHVFTDQFKHFEYHKGINKIPFH